MAKQSPTSRTLQRLREVCCIAQVVEQKVRTPKGSFSRDLFNVIDIICLHGHTTVGIQVTSGSNHAARRAKSLAEPKLRAWLEAGNYFQIRSWSKKGPRGKRKTWQERVEDIYIGDLPSLQEQHP